MLRWALLFLLVALLAALFGFTGIAGESLQFARILLFVFLVMFALSIVLGWSGRRRPPLV